jgi:hypothetical protein
VLAATAAAPADPTVRNPIQVAQVGAGGADQAAGRVPPPLATGPAADLNLVFTAQVKGWMEPWG